MPNQRGDAPVLETRNAFGRKASRWEASDAKLLFENMCQATVVTDGAVNECLRLAAINNALDDLVKGGVGREPRQKLGQQCRYAR